MTKKTLTFVLDYCDKITNKRRAHFIRVKAYSNLKSEFDSYRTITNTKGEKAELEIIAFASTIKDAIKMCDYWNETYKKEHRHFDL